MWLVAVNPTSGSGKGSLYGSQVVGFLRTRGIDYTLITGNSPETLRTNLSRALDTAPLIHGVISVGGDGLIHAVIQECAPRKIAFAAIPAGTGNDFVRTLGWDLENIEEILVKIVETHPQPIDMGLVDGEWFVNILSTGFDSIVNERANRISWPKGPHRYNMAIALELPTFKPRSYRISLDDVEFQTEAMLIAVANGISYGGGMKVAPEASYTDGLFDVLVLEPVSKIEFIKVFPKVFSGDHLSHPAVQIRRSKKISISASAVAYADGERIGQLPVSAECIHLAGKTWMR